MQMPVGLQRDRSGDASRRFFEYDKAYVATCLEAGDLYPLEIFLLRGAGILPGREEKCDSVSLCLALSFLSLPKHAAVL